MGYYLAGNRSTLLIHTIIQTNFKYMLGEQSQTLKATYFDPIYITFCFKNVYFYWKSRETEQEWTHPLLNPLVHCSNACSGQDEAEAEARSQECNPGLLLVAGTQYLSHPHCLSRTALVGNLSQEPEPGIDQVLWCELWAS